MSCSNKARSSTSLVRHEQAAVHAADGYARATGKCGICLVTLGQGATNAVTDPNIKIPTVPRELGQNKRG
jgi:thiamine pyrophosphate-dependent acetolactate synthase large subunit-like protein